MSKKNNRISEFSTPVNEYSLLGCCIMDDCFYRKAKDFGININDFTIQSNKVLWGCLERMDKNEVPISLMTVTSELEKYGELNAVTPAFLARIAECYVTTKNIVPYIKEVKNATFRRQIEAQSRNTVEKLRNSDNKVNDIISDAEKNILQMSDVINENTKFNGACSDKILSYLENNFEKDLNDFAHTSARTCFPYLDSLFSGKLYPGMYVLGAISSLGKTTWLAQVADQIAESKLPVLYFSIEQSQMEIICKSLSRHISSNHLEHRISSIKIRNHWHPHMNRMENNKYLLPYEIDYINEAYDWYKANIAPYMNVCGSNFECTVETIKAKIKRMVAVSDEKPVIFIDYLQIIQPEKDFKGTDKQHLDYVMTELERLAKQLQITVFAISSINRVSYTQPVSFESFKTSGSIEYSSDVVITMDLNAINELKENSDKIEAHNLLDAAKAAIPRAIQMKILKNRYGRVGECTYFLYYPDGDYFKNVEELPPASIVSKETYNTPIRGNNNGVH